MKLTDWYISTKFGSRLTSPDYWARSRPIYDALTSAEQLEWRRTRTSEALLFLPLLAAILSMFALMIIDMATDTVGDRVDDDIIPHWYIFTGIGVAALIMGVFYITYRNGYRQRRRLFPALAALRSIPRPAHVSRITWSIAWDIPVSPMVYVSKKQRAAGHPYALAFDQATDEQRIALRLSVARRFAVGPALALIAMVPLGFALGYMPYLVSLLAHLLTFLCCFAIGFTYMHIWTRRVWPKHILGETPQRAEHPV